jgi:hypothetical protein
LFRPDSVFVRLEPYVPRQVSPEDRRAFAQIHAQYMLDNYRPASMIGDLSCNAPKSGGSLTLCQGHRNSGNRDVISLQYSQYRDSPFVLLQADYALQGLEVFWQVRTSDVGHWQLIDEAIWSHISDWNLLNPSNAHNEQR